MDTSPAAVIAAALIGTRTNAAPTIPKPTQARHSARPAAVVDLLPYLGPRYQINGGDWPTAA